MSRRDGKVLLVATTGGHLMQLAELAPRLPLRQPRLWVTFDSEQARTLLAGEEVRFIPFIGERDVAGVMRTLPVAQRILTREGPIAAVISTGSAIALSFLPLATLHGIPAHYVESAARTGQPSITGRVLQWAPSIRLYRQYRHCAAGRWRYGGSVFDGFESVTHPAVPIRRAVVTLGTMTQGFRRLLDRLQMILPSTAEVLWQTGETPTDGLGIEARRYLAATALVDAMRQADLVVAHAGCGSALTALIAGKCPVLVPRDPGSGEIVDAHQREIAQWLDARGLAVARSVDRLTFADLQLAASRRVRRAVDVPGFELVVGA